MNGETNVGSFWIEEINETVQTTVRKKRKYKTKKKEYNGWGSTSLIWFLESIGIDTSKEITQSEVAKIISDYVKNNNLFHPMKKKRIVCDERLHSLFGRKTIGRLKISDLLETHIAKNCEESDDDILYDSDDDEDFLATCETPKPTSLERKSYPKKPVMEKPRSCFAAINPSNIKLVYLKRSLVEELLNDPESFENKVVGSFIRIKCDRNDYLQKNSHQLLQVTGIKKSSGGDGAIRLKASGFIKDISTHMLSDDNFSEAECADLNQRVKDGSLKRLMFVDMEQMARVLHEDITKHWLARELALLENLIERANEKGWRRELGEYLQRREKLQSPDEQERLLHETPQVIADDLESESTTNVADKKVEKELQDLWQPTCTKASLETEVPKTVANGFACKVTRPYKKLRGSDEQEQSFHEIPHVIANDLESESTMPDVADKKLENKLQDFWQPTCTKASLVTEVPKTDANGFACKVTEPYKKRQGSDEQELLLYEIPQVIADDSELESTTPDIANKKVEIKLQDFWQPTCAKASLVTEVPKRDANGFACKVTKPYKKLQGSDEQEWLLYEKPEVIADDLQLESTTPDVADKKVEIKLQDFWQPICTKASLVTEVPKTDANGFGCEVAKLCEKLQGSDEKECLLHETPHAIADDLEPESTTPDVPDKEVRSNLQEWWQTTNTKTSIVTEVSKAVTNGFARKATKLDITNFAKQESCSPKSILTLSRASEVPPFNMTMNSSMLGRISRDTATENLWSSVPVQQKPAPHINSAYKNGVIFQPAEANIPKISQGPPDKPQVQPSQIPVIELSDDEEEEEEENEAPTTIKQVPAEQLDSLIWYYRDPQGNMQGPFSIINLKRWSDACYFTPDFKVWKSGQTQDQGVLLLDILPQFFPRATTQFTFL